MTQKGMTEPLVRLSEVLCALSHAFDLAEGQPNGHSVRSCLIGMRLGQELNLDSEIRSALYYALLLKDAGCSSNSSHVAALFGSDDHRVKWRLRTVNWSRLPDAVLSTLRAAAIGRPLAARLRHIVQLTGAGGRVPRELVRMRCERGAEMVRRLGFSTATAEAIHAVDEHWDGRGYPDGLRGPKIPLLARIACLAQTTDVFLMFDSVRGALRTVRERRGRWFDPDLADVVLSWGDDKSWWDALCGPEVTRLAVEAEPTDRIRRIGTPGLNEVAEAFADITDVKTPFTYKHSRRVAAYARDIARELGADAATQLELYRAGLLHDIGKLGVSNRILEKTGALTRADWMAIKQHPIHTRQILDQIRVFREFAWTASLHHERLDGSGYPWKLDGSQLSAGARILAVSDAYEAMTSWRPYCAPVPPDTALFLLEKERGERLDADSVDALHQYLARTGDASPPGDSDVEDMDETGPMTTPIPLA
jgi:putative nucleotidyltransferase with HDIG domain